MLNDVFFYCNNRFDTKKQKKTTSRIFLKLFQDFRTGLGTKSMPSYLKRVRTV